MSLLWDLLIDSHINIKLVNDQTILIILEKYRRCLELIEIGIKKMMNNRILEISRSNKNSKKIEEIQK